jgi:hypothetical protein
MIRKEKRLQPRVEVTWSVTMLTPEGSISGETRDISMQGAFICCEEPLPPDERFILSVRAPTASMQVMAQVVWSKNYTNREEDETVGMGVRFIWS